MTLRIVLVEDDAQFGAYLQRALAADSHEVGWEREAQAGERALRQNPHDLVVLDLRLPDRAGIEMLVRYRARGGAAPILAIAANSTPSDRVTALDAGADDFLCRPFESDELFAHIRALLRRPTRQTVAPIHYRGITLDPARHETFVYGVRVDLPPRQFAVLHALMNQPGHIVTHEELKERLYGLGDEPDSNPLAVFIHELRDKLGRNSITTVRGIGYILSGHAD